MPQCVKRRKKDGGLKARRPEGGGSESDQAAFLALLADSETVWVVSVTVWSNHFDN